MFVCQSLGHRLHHLHHTQLNTDLHRVSVLPPPTTPCLSLPATTSMS